MKTVSSMIAVIRDDTHDSRDVTMMIATTLHGILVNTLHLWITYTIGSALRACAIIIVNYF